MSLVNMKDLALCVMTITSALSFGGCALLAKPDKTDALDWQVPQDLDLGIQTGDKPETKIETSVVRYVIRSHWSKSSIPIVKESKLSENSKYAALFLLSFQEYVKGGCNKLSLLEIRPNDHRVVSQLSTKESAILDEIWKVDACSANLHYRVSDDGVPVKLDDDAA